jgi:hypothetical protein
MISKLPFKTKKARMEYLYTDFVYEIFGCANTVSTNLTVHLRNWVEKLNDEWGEFKLGYFSLDESGLSIQSTFHFLSKTYVRVREMYMPLDGVEMWDKFDIIVTTNEKIVKTKPEGKTVVLIRMTDNKKAEKKADFVYDSLQDLIDDEKFMEKVLERNSMKLQRRSDSTFSKTLRRVKKLFTRN